MNGFHHPAARALVTRLERLPVAQLRYVEDVALAAGVPNLRTDRVTDGHIALVESATRIAEALTAHLHAAGIDQEATP